MDVIQYSIRLLFEKYFFLMIVKICEIVIIYIILLCAFDANILRDLRKTVLNTL